MKNLFRTTDRRSRLTSPLIVLAAGSLLTSWVLGCSEDAGKGGDGDGSSGPTDNGGTDTDSGGDTDQLTSGEITSSVSTATTDTDIGGLTSSAGGPDSSDTSDSAGTSDTSGSGTSEVCDGVDNDGNGITDDVDAGGDGICDCLRIGTLGTIGPWSNGGNIFRDWLNARSSTPAVEIGHGALTAEVLSELDVLVVLRVDTAELIVGDLADTAHPAFSTDEISAFDSWVRAGGGVLTTLGYQSDETAEMVNVNQLLSLTSPVYSADTGLDGFIKTWLTHPIALGVSNINNSNGVVVDETTGEVVARDDNGKAALVAREVDAGHVIVWGDEWITYDSEWVSAEDQQVELLWLNMLKWLSPIQTCQVPIPDDILR